MSERGETSQSASQRKRNAPRREPRGGRRVRRAAGEPITQLPQPVDINALRGNFPSVKDANDHRVLHMSEETSVSNIQFCGSPKFLAALYAKLPGINVRIKAAIDSTKWHSILSVPAYNHDQKVVLSLVERWWDTTHTFHLPGVELGFTPFDFTCLTGIPVGKGAYPPYDLQKWKNFDMVQSYFPCIDPSDCDDSSGIKCTYLKNYLNTTEVPEAMDISESPTAEESAAEVSWLRAFFLLVLGKVFFLVSKKWVSYGWLEAFEDVYRVGEYD